MHYFFTAFVELRLSLLIFSVSPVIPGQRIIPVLQLSSATVQFQGDETLGVKTLLFIEPGSPWENGYIASFNGKLRDELLNGEIFMTLLEAQVLIENWRWGYNHFRPHSTLGYRPPAPETILPFQKEMQISLVLTNHVVQ
jgi:hypothetical protein